MVRFFVFILMLCIPSWGMASKYVMNENCKKAYDLILNLRFTEAEKILQAEKVINPGNNIIPYLENYEWFLKVIISEEEPIFKNERNLRQQRLRQFENGDPNSPWHLYCQAQFNMQWAFARIKFGEYPTAAVELNRSYRQLTRNQELFPSFWPNKVALGLLHILIGSIPDNYQWVAKTLAVKGTINQGITELQQVIKHPEVFATYHFLRTEGLFMLTFVTFNLASATENTELLEQQFSHPAVKPMIYSNPLLTYAASAYYLHTGRTDKALDYLINRPKGNKFYPFHYLDYLTGVARLNKLEPEARLFFLRYVTAYKGKSFIKSAYQRLAWIELLNNDIKGYRTYIDRIKLFGNNDIDGDKQALSEAGQISPPDVTLLKARLLFDGGYFEQAASLLNDTRVDKFSDPREKLEYTYRLARIYDESGLTEKAILNYQLTINKGVDQPWYFAANAALHLGMIFEKAGNKEKAINYYQKCLSMNFDEYRNSISQKAKAGLNRVK